MLFTFMITWNGVVQSNETFNFYRQTHFKDITILATNAPSSANIICRIQSICEWNFNGVIKEFQKLTSIEYRQPTAGRQLVTRLNEEK